MNCRECIIREELAETQQRILNQTQSDPATVVRHELEGLEMRLTRRLDPDALVPVRVYAKISMVVVARNESEACREVDRMLNELQDKGRIEVTSCAYPHRDNRRR